MKHFILKIIYYGVFTLLLLEGISTFLINNVVLTKKISISSSFLGQRAIYNRTNKKIYQDTLFIGDSVVRQIFGKQEKKPNYYTSFAGILVQGNYVILKKVLDKNPQIKVVLYGMTPTSLSFSFNEEGTSLNYIKPYQSIYDYENLDLNSLNQMKTKPISFLYLFSFGKFLPIDDINFKTAPIDRKYISEDAILYLDKMKTFCDERGIEFILYMAPIVKKRVQVTNNFMLVKERVKNTSLESLFERYFRTMIIMDDSYFRDGFHFHNSKIKEEGNSISKMVLDKIKKSI